MKSKPEPEKKEIAGDADFKEFFEEKFINYADDVTIKLYRVSKVRGHTFKTYLRKYINVIPDEDEIGSEFGGGQYWAISNDLEGQVVDRLIFIDELFTERLNAEKAKQNFNQMPQAQLPAQVPHQIQYDPFKSFKTILEAVTPIVAAMSKGAARPADPQGGTLDGITEAFTNSMSKIQEFLIDKQLEKLEGGREPVTNDNNSIVSEVLQIIRQWGPHLIKANGKKAEALKSIVTDDARFQQLQDDPDVIDAIYTMGSQDPEIGQEKMDRIFEKLGFGAEASTQGGD